MNALKALHARFALHLMLVAALLCGGSLMLPLPADAALTLRTSAKTAMMSGIISDAGTGAKLLLYNGTKPAALGAVTGGNTLLATLTWTGNIGTAVNGTIDFDEAGAAQNNATHVAGTPTFARITTSGNVVVLDIDIGAGAGNWQFTGTVAPGQNVTLSGLVISAGN